MIPKKIHYIWLGGKKKSKLAESCILSWKLKNPEFEIIEWNEKNLNLDKIAQENIFFAECRKRKLWAFMADYLRIKILYENGGIYIDTDVQALKPIEDLLNQSHLIGYEVGNNIGTGIIGASKNNELMKNILEFYNKEIMLSKEYTIPNVMKIEINRMEEKGKKVKIFPMDFFSPYDYREEFNEKCLTANSYTIHWFDGSWTENKQVSVFLQTKYIKNPIKKKIIQIKKMMGYYYRKLGNKKNGK